MKDEFNYEAVPFHFVHCLNATCPRGESCLRRLTAQHAPKEIPAIMTVNPAVYPKDANRCPYFKSTEKLRYAWGLTTTFDNIPYKKALLLKSRIHQLYPKTTYYRILHKERPLSPAEQEAIANIFAQNGVSTAPEFDSYTEEYAWE